MTTFRAYRINKQDDGIVAGFEEMAIDDLTEGKVLRQAYRAFFRGNHEHVRGLRLVERTVKALTVGQFN